MLIIDDILLSPVKGLLLVFEEIHRAVESETHDTASVVDQLQELYMRLETGKISTVEFDLQEKALLDRLDRAEGQGESRDEQSV
ncbi:MAG: gas vesicle protein GvpG [Candidatus Riflebacteria bacterium]|nr:gas vesicle protein GvpG [Candidatus Riflebacteria bacterium]